MFYQSQFATFYQSNHPTERYGDGRRPTSREERAADQIRARLRQAARAALERPSARRSGAVASHPLRQGEHAMKAGDDKWLSGDGTAHVGPDAKGIWETGEGGHKLSPDFVDDLVDARLSQR